jgi:hypothetical protein
MQWQHCFRQASQDYFRRVFSTFKPEYSMDEQSTTLGTGRALAHQHNALASLPKVSSQARHALM